MLKEHKLEVRDKTIKKLSAKITALKLNKVGKS